MQADKMIMLKWARDGGHMASVWNLLELEGFISNGRLMPEDGGGEARPLTEAEIKAYDRGRELLYNGIPEHVAPHLAGVMMGVEEE